MTDAYKAGREAGIREAAAKCSALAKVLQEGGNPRHEVHIEVLMERNAAILALLDNAPAPAGPITTMTAEDLCSLLGRLPKKFAVVGGNNRAHVDLEEAKKAVRLIFGVE